MSIEEYITRELHELADIAAKCKYGRIYDACIDQITELLRMVKTCNLVGVKL